MLNKCPGCGGNYQPFDGPVHKYMTSSPACWQAYGVVLAREYGNQDLFAAAHRLTVDAFALQHPGSLNDRRAVQSVNLHYMSLWLVFEKDYPLNLAGKALKTLADHEFESRAKAPTSYGYTLLDFDSQDHANSAKQWAQSAFDAWSDLKSGAAEIAGKFNL